MASGVMDLRAKRHRKVPPFGKILFQRLQFANPPLLVAVCLGKGAFTNALSWTKRGTEFAGLVAPDAEPEQYVWPVAGASCLIDWDEGPADVLIARLALCLHRSGARSVASRCLFEDCADWHEGFNLKTGNWDRLRHGLHFYCFDTQDPLHAQSR